MDRERFDAVLKGIGLDLTQDQLSAFEAFEESLYAANESMNLTRVAREECWLRHFVDSLLFHDLLPEGAKVLDIGTGPGFPAWPLAVARPDLHIAALDSSGKMLGFLRTMPLPNLEVMERRAEEWGVREEFDVVTGRAVAPLTLQLELSAALCTEGGMVAPMRTPNDEDSIMRFSGSVLGLRREAVIRRPLPETDIVRVSPVYRKVGPTPAKYPRPWAEMKRKPLGP